MVNLNSRSDTNSCHGYGEHSDKHNTPDVIPSKVILFAQLPYTCFPVKPNLDNVNASDIPAQDCLFQGSLSFSNRYISQDEDQNIGTLYPYSEASSSPSRAGVHHCQKTRFTLIGRLDGWMTQLKDSVRPGSRRLSEIFRAPFRGFVRARAKSNLKNDQQQLEKQIVI